jgi:hypothetical protein
MGTQEPTREQVVAWLTSVRRDIETVQGRLAPLMEQQHRLEARQLLLTDLLSSYDAGDLPARKSPSDNAAGPPSQLSRSSGSIGRAVRRRAEEILRAAGRPLHINELHAEFLRRGFPVPGAGKPVNLIVHLRKSDTIVSPARGIYGLVEHVGEIPRTKARAKRRPRSRQRKS